MNIKLLFLKANIKLKKYKKIKIRAGDPIGNGGSL